MEYLFAKELEGMSHLDGWISLLLTCGAGWAGVQNMSSFNTNLLLWSLAFILLALLSFHLFTTKKTVLLTKDKLILEKSILGAIKRKSISIQDIRFMEFNTNVPFHRSFLVGPSSSIKYFGAVEHFGLKPTCCIRRS